MYPGNWSKQADCVQLVEKNRLGRAAKLDEQGEYGTAEVTLAEKRIVVLQQRCSEYSQRSAAPDLKHNERGAGRKKALSEDQIAEFEKPQQLFFVQKETSGKTINMNVRKGENGVKRTREHKEFPGGNDSGLSDLDGMERLCCCRKETFCFRQLPRQQQI